GCGPFSDNYIVWSDSTGSRNCRPAHGAGFASALEARFGGLPKQFHAKLNLPGIAGLVDLPEVGVANQAIGVPELCMVQGVEEFRPELEVHRFPKLSALFDGKVPVVIARPGDDESSGVSKESGRRRGKARGVQPVQAVGAEVGILQFGSPIAQSVRPEIGQGSRRVVGGIDGKRIARRECSDDIGGPSSYNTVPKRRHTLREALAF